jgi:hypothetical protein
VGIAQRVLVESKQLPESVNGEVSLSILLLVDDTGGERLLVGLALEDLLFDRAGGDEPVDKAFFLLPVTPDASKGLLISGWVPICKMWLSISSLVITDEVYLGRRESSDWLQ